MRRVEYQHKMYALTREYLGMVEKRRYVRSLFYSGEQTVELEKSGDVFKIYYATYRPTGEMQEELTDVRRIILTKEWYENVAEHEDSMIAEFQDEDALVLKPYEAE